MVWLFLIPMGIVAFGVLGFVAVAIIGLLIDAARDLLGLPNLYWRWGWKPWTTERPGEKWTSEDEHDARVRDNYRRVNASLLPEARPADATRPGDGSTPA